ncbi:MAG: pyridoxal 5'-phosphate synthase glutaminase subunit PdxT [Acidilobaceae archaeon]
MAVRVGIIAVQGGFEEHVYMVSRACRELELSCETVLAKKPEDLERASALILPGGEFTAMRRLLERSGLAEKLQELVAGGAPAMAVSSGAALLARSVYDKATGRSYGSGLGLLRADAIRNYFGRQRESFEADLKLDIPFEPEKPYRAVFIRAPVFANVDEDVKVLGRLGENPVALDQGSLIALSFHPELTSDTRLHKLLLARAR